MNEIITRVVPVRKTTFGKCCSCKETIRSFELTLQVQSLNEKGHWKPEENYGPCCERIMRINNPTIYVSKDTNDEPESAIKIREIVHAQNDLVLNAMKFLEF